MDQRITFQEEIIRIRKERTKIGSLLTHINITYEGKLKWALRAIIYWLRSENSLLFRNKKHQKALDRKYWHEAAEIMGLKHFTIEYTQCRHFCNTHNKYCSKWKSSAGKYSNGKCYDSDHECSGDDKYRSSEEEHCDPEEKIMKRRNVYILAPECNGIDSVEQLTDYLESNGYMNKPPFRYSYKSRTFDDDYFMY